MCCFWFGKRKRLDGIVVVWFCDGFLGGWLGVYRYILFWCLVFCCVFVGLFFLVWNFWIVVSIFVGLLIICSRFMFLGEIMLLFIRWVLI